MDEDYKFEFFLLILFSFDFSLTFPWLTKQMKMNSLPFFSFKIFMNNQIREKFYIPFFTFFFPSIFFSQFLFSPTFSKNQT